MKLSEMFEVWSAVVKNPELRAELPALKKLEINMDSPPEGAGVVHYTGFRPWKAIASVINARSNCPIEQLEAAEGIVAYCTSAFGTNVYAEGCASIRIAEDEQFGNWWLDYQPPNRGTWYLRYESSSGECNFVAQIRGDTVLLIGYASKRFWEALDKVKEETNLVSWDTEWHPPVRPTAEVEGATRIFDPYEDES